jgi:hypothetical protein
MMMFSKHKWVLVSIFAMLLIAGGFLYWKENKTLKLVPLPLEEIQNEEEPQQEEIASTLPPDCLPQSVICVSFPKNGQEVGSPLVITGEARGYWFFEASFPVTLTDWDGKIIAEHYATAKSDWMTENFVPFEATLTFENPYKLGDPDFMKNGYLILQKDNPSGLPENDAAIEIPVTFGL